MLKGFKLGRDVDRLAGETADILMHLEHTKGLNAKDEFFYIETFESSDPKKAIDLYEKHLLAITPNRPKNILNRLAYLTSKLPLKIQDAKKYFEELYGFYLRKTTNQDDYLIVRKYLEFAITNKFYTKEKMYELYNLAEKLNSKDLDLYRIFAEFLINSSDAADIKYCSKVVDEGLRIAIEIDKMHFAVSKSLRRLKEALIVKAREMW